jgi:RHS repeat-associated protein
MNVRGEEYKRIEYTPYGEIWIDNASAASNLDIPYRFIGKERDTETGLYYYGARYLDSKTGRWLSTDPALAEYIPEAPVNDAARKRNAGLPGMGGIYNTINAHLYHYAGNNPVKYTDPNGMWDENVEVAVNNNLNQTYEYGVNDCDIWVETVLEESGVAMPDSWSSATSTNVATHIQEMQNDLQDAPAQGTNIVFQGNTHILIIGVNTDGTVDVAHQGWNSIPNAEGKNEYSRQIQYANVAAFEASSWGANATLRYVPVGNTQTAQPAASGGGRASGGGSYMMLSPVGTFSSIMGFGRNSLWK